MTWHIVRKTASGVGCVQSGLLERFDFVRHGVTLGGAPLQRINLSFSKAMDDKPQVTTKGRTLDHIGFDVKNLEAFLKRYEAAGGKIDRPYTKNAQSNTALAFIYDPWGTYIELNERPDTPSATTAAR